MRFIDEQGPSYKFTQGYRPTPTLIGGPLRNPSLKSSMKINFNIFIRQSTPQFESDALMLPTLPDLNPGTKALGRHWM